MTHEHVDAAAGGNRRRLSIALAIAAGTAVLELWGSVVTGSLALFADAGHVLADVGALALALVAVWFAARPHTLRRTFGYHRAEVLAAALSALLLLGVAVLISWRALDRLRSPAEVDAVGLTVIALGGLLANAVMALVLRGRDSVNIRAARLHVLSDLGGSVAAVTAGVLTAATGSTRVDPLLSLVIVALVVFGALRLLRETVAILMASVPPGLDLSEIDEALRALPGVRAVHDMHCWTITSGFIVFACHVQLAAGSDGPGVVEQATQILRERFEIDHVTIQTERPPVLDLRERGT